MENVHLHLCRKCGKDLGPDSVEYFCEGCFPDKAPRHEHHERVKILAVGGESPITAQRMQQEREKREQEVERKRIIEKLASPHNSESLIQKQNEHDAPQVDPTEFVHGECRVCGKPTAIDSHVFCPDHVRVKHFAEPQPKVHVLGVYNVESPQTERKKTF